MRVQVQAQEPGGRRRRVVSGSLANPAPSAALSSFSLWTSPHSNPVLIGLHRLLSNPQASSIWFSNANICSVLEV